MLDSTGRSRRPALWLDRSECRAFCHRCRRPKSCCYCSLISPFKSEPRFIILTQPREAKHRLGTGRMAHLCLANSSLFEGVGFSDHRRVNREIDEPANGAALLYLSPDSINLSGLAWYERQALFPRHRQPVIFVLDGTWRSVRKMLRLSNNLARLPRICFDPPVPSAYRIRREPGPQCYSTLEAIHQVIELFATEMVSEAPSVRPHDTMLDVLHAVTERQLSYTVQAYSR